jgi:methyl-accepting chemotaxis protein
MDELTQQNAALVEQATAASQGMATQAGSLNGMLDHYDFTGVAGVSSAFGSASVTPRVSSEKQPGSHAAPRVERRKATRPWANRSAPKNSPAAPRPEAAVAPVTRAPARAENSADSNEWTEF